MRPTVKLWKIATVSAWNSAPQDEKLFKNWKYPFYRTADVWKVHYSRNLTEVKDYLNEEWIKWLKLYKKWTILFPKSWASTFLNHRVIMWQDWYVVSHLATISVNEDVDENFIYYYLTTVDAKDLCADQWYPSLKSSNIAEVEIPLPPLETQKAVVAKLDQIFTEFDKTKSKIQKNLNNIEWFWESVLNQALQGDWEMKKLGEICEASIWLTYKPENVSDTWIIVLRSSNIKDRELDFDDIVRVNIDVKEELKVKEWDILMCARNWSKRLVGKSALIRSLPEEMTYWTFMMIIRSKYNKYLQYFFESDRFFKQIRTDNGPMINQITKYMIVDVVAPIPPFSEQEKIVEHLDQVSKEVKALKSQYQSQLDNLEELKKSVLDKAFRWELGE